MLAKYAIVRLEGTQYRIVSASGKVSFRTYTVRPITDHTKAREETHGIMGTVVATTEGCDPAHAWEKFHRDNCACARSLTRGDYKHGHEGAGWWDKYSDSKPKRCSISRA